jgi:hypothetical protein
VDETTCTECRERPKRRRADGRTDGALCVECQGRRHKAARKAYRKRSRQERPGYVPRTALHQMAAYRRGAREVFRDLRRAERETAPLPEPTTFKGLQVQAMNQVYRAVRSGRLVKPETCSECGTKTERHRLHAHHENYRKPIDVVWLCASCHGRLSAAQQWNTPTR